MRPKRRIGLVLLDHLDRHGSSYVDSLAVLVFGETNARARSRVVESLLALQERGLVLLDGPPHPAGRRVATRTEMERPIERGRMTMRQFVLYERELQAEALAREAEA